nr:hypothetical protein [uncultured Prevotella sp.]
MKNKIGIGRELRVYVEIVDENGNHVYPDGEIQYVSTPLRNNAAFEHSYDFYKVLGYLGSCISVTMRRDHVLSSLYPETPYYRSPLEELRDEPSALRPIWSEWGGGTVGLQHPHKGSEESENVLK